MKHHQQLCNLLDIFVQIQLFPYSVIHIRTNLTKWSIQSSPILTRSKMHVLVLAGSEIFSFTVASMGLCFGYVLKTVLVIIQGCFSYC